MSEFGSRQAFGLRYISFWGYIRLNLDINCRRTGKIIMKKGSYTMAIVAEDPDRNRKAKVLNPSNLFDASLVTLTKSATQTKGEGDFDFMSDVPIPANYEMARKDYEELVEIERWNNGEYDDFILMGDDGVMH